MKYHFLKMKEQLFQKYCLKYQKSLSDPLSKQSFLEEKLRVLILFSSSTDKLEWIKSVSKRITFPSLNIEKKYISKMVLWVVAWANFNDLIELSKNSSIQDIFIDLHLFLCREKVQLNSDKPNSNTIIKPLKKLKLDFLRKIRIDIALFDTGIDSKRLKSIGKVLHECNITDENIEDLNGHGTFIAQILEYNQNFQSKGDFFQSIQEIANPQIYLHDYKIFNRDGSAYLSDLLFALHQLIQNIENQPEGEKIQILLIPATTSPAEGYEPLFTPILKEIKRLNIQIICAAGNFGPEPGSLGYPAKSSDVLTVGSLNLSGKNDPAFFSSQLIISNEEKEEIYPIIYDLGKIETSAPLSFSGTSVAAAQFCAKFLIIKALYPMIDTDSLIDLIKKTSNSKITLIKKTKIYTLNLNTILKKLGWWKDSVQNIRIMVLQAIGISCLLLFMFLFSFFLF
ncbi:MAG: S8/S53 family peptidase [Candidatus Lokiarchaeota archaeon]|nr:S8/S53 family peptidase [Candidatus Harpocratesius repetitus]